MGTGVHRSVEWNREGKVTYLLPARVQMLTCIKVIHVLVAFDNQHTANNSISSELMHCRLIESIRKMASGTVRYQAGLEEVEMVSFFGCGVGLWHRMFFWYIMYISAHCCFTHVHVVVSDEGSMLLIAGKGAGVFCCNPLGGGCNTVPPLKGEYVQVVSVEEVTINRPLITCKGAVLLCCNPLVGGCNKVAPVKGEFAQVVWVDEVSINRLLKICKGVVLLCCNPLVDGCNKVAPLRGEFSDVDVNTNVHGIWLEKGAYNISSRVLGFSLYRRR